MTNDESLHALVVFEGLVALVVAVESLQPHARDELRVRNGETFLPGIRVALNDHPQHLRHAQGVDAAGSPQPEAVRMHVLARVPRKLDYSRLPRQQPAIRNFDPAVIVGTDVPGVAASQSR